MELKTVLVMCMFAVVCRAGDLDFACPESDNPINFQFTVGNEVLQNGTEVSPDIIFFPYMPANAVACEKNYNADLAKKLRVRCDSNTDHITCELHPKCVQTTDNIISKLVEHVLQYWPDLLKVKAINFFKDYPVVRELVFGVERLSDLNGFNIYDIMTEEEPSLKTGFAISNEVPKPTVEQWVNEFNETLAYFDDFPDMEYVPGKYKASCTISKKDRPDLTLENAKTECKEELFKAIDKRAEADEKYAFLGKAIDHMVRSLTNNKKSYPGLKLPLWGDCLEDETEENKQVEDKP